MAANDPSTRNAGRSLYRSLFAFLFERRDESEKEYDDGLVTVTEVGLNRVERFAVGAFVAVFTAAVIGFWYDALPIVSSGSRFEFLLLGSLLPAAVPITLGTGWAIQRIARAAWIPRDCDWCRESSTETHTLSPPESTDEDGTLRFCSRSCRQCWERKHLESVPERFVRIQTYAEERDGAGHRVSDRRRADLEA